MALNITLLIIGLIGLWFGAGRIVNAGKAIALRLGISTFLVGLTVVSIGTSLPEIMVTTFSGIKGNSDIAVGSMIGSCLTQITLILGIGGLIHNIHVRRKAILIDGPMLLVAILLFALFLATGMRMSPFEGILLIIIYIGYLWFTVKHDTLRKQVHDQIKDPQKFLPFVLHCVEIVVGIAVLIYSVSLVIDNAIILARLSGLSESFIGVIIIGSATGLPELSTAVMGVIKKTPGISIGSLIGGNITDPLLSIGVGSLFGGFTTDPGLLMFDIPFWFIVSAIALLVLHSDRLTLNKFDGVTMVLVYMLFLLSKFMTL